MVRAIVERVLDQSIDTQIVPPSSLRRSLMEPATWRLFRLRFQLCHAFAHVCQPLGLGRVGGEIIFLKGID